jgi:PDZ domain-containing protein
MTRKWMPFALAVAMGMPLAARAQQTPRPARPEPAPRARVRERVGEPMMTYTFSGNRARLGVLVNTAANADTDKIGARLAAVTPGGPAAKAGLKAGDVITKFNGTTLAGEEAEDEDESGPGHKLIELAHDLDVGDTVQVEYRRGPDTKKATIVAEEVEGGGRVMTTLGGPGEHGFSFSTPPMAELMPTTPWITAPRMTERGFSFCFGDSWCDLDLVRLNPDLGEYFGTSEGLLVVKAPGDSGLALRSGDVILAIGGRKPTSAEHAMRILRSYDEGETVSIDVMRKQKRMTVTWKVPDRDEMRPSRAPRRGTHGEPSEFHYNVIPKVRAEIAARSRVKTHLLRTMKLRHLQAI